MSLLFPENITESFISPFTPGNDPTNLIGNGLVASGGIGPVPFGDTAAAVGLVPGGFAPPGVAFGGDPFFEATNQALLEENLQFLNGALGLPENSDLGTALGSNVLPPSVQTVLGYDPNSSLGFGAQAINNITGGAFQNPVEFGFADPLLGPQFDQILNTVS